MNYWHYSCQIFIVLPLFFFFSCGSDEKKIQDAEYKAPELIEAKPVWFNGPDRFRTLTKERNIPTHPFFDLMPYWLPKSSTLSFVMTTPKDSSYLYNFDLKTGKRYLRHKFCPQRDVWGRFKGTILKPPFSEGLVPRLLDQTGQPQSIFVFGESRYFQNKNIETSYSERVRVVGGLVLQYCRYYPCKGARSWKSRLILVAVNPKDPKLTNIHKIEELRKKVNWNYVRAYVENYRGRKVLTNKEYPSYRIVGEVSALKAGQYAFRRGFLFDIDNMNMLRKQCYKLYDYAWNHMEKIRNYSPEQEQAKKMTIKKDPQGFYKNKFGSNVINDDLKEMEMIDTSKKLDDQLNFNGNFDEFYTHLLSNYKRQMRTCFKYVQSTNINHDVRRHWTFAYLENFFNLDELEQTFRCTNKVWLDNPVMLSGKRQYRENYNYCTTESFNRAMERGVTRMAVLKKRDSEYYQYLEYDNGAGGSHEKVYSWTYRTGKNVSCAVNKKSKDKTGQIVELDRELFPLDISWDFFVDDKTRDGDLIIR